MKDREAFFGRQDLIAQLDELWATNPTAQPTLSKYTLKKLVFTDFATSPVVVLEYTRDGFCRNCLHTHAALRVFVPTSRRT